jgi:hypothetical protein
MQRMDGASHHPKTQDLAWLNASRAREKGDPSPRGHQLYLIPALIGQALALVEFW